MGGETMKAVVFKGPFKVVIEDRPVPKIKEETDMIVKVDKVAYKIHHVLPRLTSLRRHFVEGMIITAQTIVHLINVSTQ
jgi:hypothetical protein